MLFILCVDLDYCLGLLSGWRTSLVFIVRQSSSSKYLEIFVFHLYFWKIAFLDILLSVDRLSFEHFKYVIPLPSASIVSSQKSVNIIGILLGMNCFSLLLSRFSPCLWLSLFYNEVFTCESFFIYSAWNSLSCLYV